MRVRNEHWNALMVMCEKNPELITNKVNGPNARECMKNMWHTVANNLNSLGFGEKSVSDWKKAITDWRSKTKSKAAKLSNDMRQTGGGEPINNSPLSNLELKLLQIMGNVAVEGDLGIVEVGFGQVVINNEEVENIVINNQDHNYSENEMIPHGTKRPLSNENQRRKRLRHNKAIEVSEQLSDMNKDTLNVLKNIDQNISDIAQSLRIFSENLKK